MTRKEFFELQQNGCISRSKKPLISGKSVCDPTFARTGRQLIFNPLNIEYRMKYPDGVPLNKENPMHFNEFDKMYPDTFKAIREAETTTKSTKEHLDKLQRKYKEQQQSQQQQSQQQQSQQQQTN